MVQYEFIEVSIDKKEKDRTIWEVTNGVDVSYVEVNVGRGDIRKATMQAMNKLGKEGWSLCSYPYNYYVFHMQRIRK